MHVHVFVSSWELPTTAKCITFTRLKRFAENCPLPLLLPLMKLPLMEKVNIVCVLLTLPRVCVNVIHHLGHVLFDLIRVQVATSEFVLSLKYIHSLSFPF